MKSSGSGSKAFLMILRLSTLSSTKALSSSSTTPATQKTSRLISQLPLRVIALCYSPCCSQTDPSIEFGVTKNIPLLPNGEQIPVTKENRLQYIYLVSHYRLNRQIKKQSDAFFEGLSDMVDPKWLRYIDITASQARMGLTLR